MSAPSQTPLAERGPQAHDAPAITPAQWMDDLESALCSLPTLGALIEAGKHAAVKGAETDNVALHVDLLLEHAVEYCCSIELKLQALVATVEQVMQAGRHAP